ncbi:Peptidoglycan-associated lipoprotein [Candidatus Electronema halotolerans]
MNTCMTRLLLCACMALPLALFTGCGPKPVEPYQQKTGAAKPDGADGASTYYDYASSDYGATDGQADQAAAGIGTDGTDMNTGSSDYSVFDSLPAAPGAGTDAGFIGADDPQQAGPAVEPLDAGSAPTEKSAIFANEDKPVAYKKKNGRSSSQMRSIYYDFDQSTVRNDQIAKMEGNAQYMKKNAKAKVIVEGNCDERGTNEYNLALGQRRAMNAKIYLVNLGIKPSRIKTVSFGEERPLFLGSEESDYALNRRTDFVLDRQR